MTQLEGVELTCSPEEAWQYHVSRQVKDADFSTYRLPEFTEDPSEVYEFLRRAEQQLILNEDYQLGSAIVNNQLAVLRGESGVLLTAEHATFHRRKRPDGTVYDKQPDTGTAALSMAVADKTNSDAIVAVGRQTGDPNYDPEHPFKKEVESIVARPVSQAHLALHGLMRARASNIDDKRGFAVLIGIGDNPSDATRTLAYDYLTAIGKDYDLAVGINQQHLRFDNNAKAPRLSPDGRIMTAIYMGTRNTTRAFSERISVSDHREKGFAALQVELSDVLRVHPDRPVGSPIEFPSQRDREIGAYLGYMFILRAVGSVALL
ncbi:hypothetical protein HYU82_01065 [Candidatus Saccharibacteria bacterium]|nr:hypothetical protein [Candidatus Saccharibacteria bacterium]